VRRPAAKGLPRRRRARTRAIKAGVVVLTLTCAPQEGPEVTPPPLAASPEIRIGLVVGASQAAITGDSGFTVLDVDGATAAAVDPGAKWLVRRDGAALAAGSSAGWTVSGQGSLTFVPRGGGSISVGGRWYRGRLAVTRARSGLTVINTLGIEEYLAGVVGAELGQREAGDREALAAQAIVSRTFAIRNLGKRASTGFDLLPSVVDQVYGGIAAEYPLSRDAVRRTAGQVLTWQGVPIDAFFFSTCAGRTAQGTEVFAAAERPYLASIQDSDGDGQPYCRISPRYRWREEWTGDQLHSVLKRSLPAVLGTPPEQVEGVRAVQVTRRSRSDRVARVTVTLDRGTIDVEGPAIRQVLHPVGEPLLRSAVFQLLESRENGRVSRLVADGAGSGHGVGFCQWGAVGRARAGQDAATILGAYFPGASIGRAY
jgi:stage II sporulation protein D